MASAIDQRYRARDEALAAMRRDLTRLVGVQSTFIADSGYPTLSLLPPYAFSPTPGNWLKPRLEEDGWSATITSNHTTIRCTVAVRISEGLRTSVAQPIVCVGAHTPLP
jgi:hypothetical protein